MVKHPRLILVVAAMMLLAACNLPEGGKTPAVPVQGDEISENLDDQANGLDDQLKPVESEIAFGEWQLKLQNGVISCPNGDIQELSPSGAEEATISIGLDGATIYFEGLKVSEAFEIISTSESAIGASYAGLGQLERGEMTFTFNFFKHPNSQDPNNALNYVIGLIEGDLRTCKYSQGFGGGSVGFYQEGVPERIIAAGEVPDPESEFLTAEANTDTPEVGNWQITYVDEIIICKPYPEPYGPSQPEIIEIGLSLSGKEMFVNGFGLSATIELVRLIGPEYKGTLNLETDGVPIEYILSMGFYPTGDDLTRLDGINGVLRYPVRYPEGNCKIRKNFIGEYVNE